MDSKREEMKILILEDDKLHLNLLEAFLKRMGFKNIIKSESGPEAIRLTKEHQPDLFFIDIIIQGMTGGEFREHLKNDPMTKDTPVVFISGIISKEEEIKLGGRLVSGDLIVAKPFSSQRIAEAIDMAFRTSI